jgi:uncharacterized protein YmfQ (DUF2313 family)
VNPLLLRRFMAGAHSRAHPKEQHMALRFTATLNAVNRGLEQTSPRSGASLIEDWEAALSDLDMPGAKGIARDLASLRRQLEAAEPDAERIEALLHRLGEATVRIADRAEKNGEKVRELGEALREAGVAQEDEEEDREAAASPRRGRQGARSGSKKGGESGRQRETA